MLFVAAFLGSMNLLKSQQMIDLENLSLPADSFWNGSDGSGYYSGNQIATFPNNFVDWGNGITSWSGFAYSNMRDTVIQYFTNQYSCFAGTQLLNSTIFGISFNNSDWNTGAIIPNVVSFSQNISPLSMQVTNNTYTALTIKNGDAYSKKFGGTTGDDPDWFKLTIIGMLDSTIKNTIEFYLADYRFANNSQDYIVKNWQSIDLSSIGTINKLSFSLSSSDTGTFGMNTPAYFCFDDISYELANSVNSNMLLSLNIFPNPSTDFIFFNQNISKVELFSISGQKLIEKTGNISNLDIRNIPNGQYIICATNKDFAMKKLIIKN